MFSVSVKYFSIIFLGIFLLSCIDGYAICPSTIKSIVTLQHNKRVREKKAKRQREKLAKDAGNTDAGVKMNSGYGNFDPDKRRTFSDTGKRLDFDPDERKSFFQRNRNSARNKN